VSRPASYPVDTGGSFLGGKADHSPPSSAELSVELYLHSPIHLHGVVLS